jgi:uncharacterized protein (DUF433 family)
MSDEELLSRTVVNRDVMVGKPVIRGTRLTVEHILNLLAHGETFDEIMAEYPGVTGEDLRACLLFASRAEQVAPQLRPK